MEKGIYKVYFDTTGNKPYKVEKVNNPTFEQTLKLNGVKTFSLKLGYRKARYMVIE